MRSSARLNGEIIGAEVGLRHLGEELLLVGEAVVTRARAVEEEGVVAGAAALERLPCRHDPRLVKTEHLVVVGVGELVEDHPRLLGDVADSRQLGRARHVDAAGEAPRITMIGEPVGTRVVLHRGQVTAGVVHHDRHLTQSREPVGRHDDADVGELRPQELEGLATHVGMLASGEETIVDENSESFDHLLGSRGRLRGVLGGTHLLGLVLTANVFRCHHERCRGRLRFGQRG